MPSASLNNLLLLSYNSTIETLKSPIQLKLAVSGEKAAATAEKKVSLPFTITLPGSGLPVLLRNVEFLVIDQEMTEVLLRRPFQHALGFNFEIHVTRVRSMVNICCIEELKCISPKLSGLSYKGMTYRDDEEDPIEPRETPPHDSGMIISRMSQMHLPKV